LQLSEDFHGLKFSMQLPNTTLARDVAALVSTGVLSQMSFGFTVPHDGDTWSRENGQTIRTLPTINLGEISDLLDAAIAQALDDRRARLERLLA
jgi:uncharacterized protein